MRLAQSDPARAARLARDHVGIAIEPGASADAVQDAIRSHLWAAGFVHFSYERGRGTSLSVAVVASVAAQVLQVAPTLSPREVHSILEKTARPVSGLPRGLKGCGCVNPREAIKAARNYRSVRRVAASLPAEHRPYRVSDTLAARRDATEAAIASGANTRRALGVLRSALDDPHPDIRTLAVHEIAVRGPRGCLGLLRRKFEQDRCRRVKIGCLRGLARLGSRQDLLTICSVLSKRGSHLHLRYVAAEILADKATRECVPWLREALSDPSASVRFFAQNALDRIEGTSVLSPSGPGIAWQKGSTHTIRWQGFSGDNVWIDLLNPAGFVKRIAATENNGTYSWTVDEGPGPQFWIGITSTNDPTDTANSENPFGITD